MRKLLILILCVFALCSSTCRRTTRSPAQTENEKHIADVNAILRLKMTKMAAWSNKNADIVTDLYEDDAFVLENGKALHGINEIKKEIATKEKVAAATNSTSGTGGTVDVTVARSGDIGYSHDTGETAFIDPKTNRAKTEKIDYVTVYEKQGNQSWKIVIDVWSSDSPAMPMTDKLLRVFRGVR
jgi:uncharacterized protein (TIGR02246 family)